MRTFTLWACQSPRAFAQLMKTGVYRCSSEELDAKYGIAADYCRSMYRWFTAAAGKHMAVPECCDYPLWLVPERERLLPSDSATVYLRLEVPVDQVLRCNVSAWEYRMACRYIPFSAEDDLAHIRELAHWGAPDDAALINTHAGNFYPLLRRKIQNSWDRVFTQLNVDPGLLAFAGWELRKEWIEEIRIEVSDAVQNQFLRSTDRAC